MYRISNVTQGNLFVGANLLGPNTSKDFTDEQIANLSAKSRHRVNAMARQGLVQVVYTAEDGPTDALADGGNTISPFGLQLLKAASGEEALDIFGMIEADGVSVDGTFETLYDPSSQLNVKLELQAQSKELVPNGGLMIQTNRVGVANPYLEDRHEVVASLSSVRGACYKTPGAPGGTFNVHDWYIDHQGLSLTKSLYSDFSTQVALNNLFFDMEDIPEAVSGFTTRTIKLPWRAGTMALEQPLVVTATTAATLTPTFSDGVTQLTALAGPCTIAAPTGSAVNGKEFLFRFLATGADRALTWNAIYRGIGVTPPATAPNGKWLYVTARYNSTGSKVDIIDVKVEA